MKTRLFILTLIAIVAVSATTAGGYHALNETLALVTSPMQPIHYDTLNRDVYSNIPPKSRAVRSVAVMSVPTSGDFSFNADNDDDDDYFDDDDTTSRIAKPRQPRKNMTDKEWVADLQARVDSVARKTRSYQKTYYTTVGKGRHKKTVKNTKNVEIDFAMGCSIFDLTADSLIYSLDADRMMKPASTQKLYTAITFLASRGNNFEFKTSVTTNGKIIKTDSTSYLQGDIYIRGSFDPTLDKGHVRQIVRAIERLDIDSIDGRIIADVRRKGALSIGGSSSSNSGMNFAQAVGKELIKDDILFPSTSPWDVSNTAVSGKTEIITLTTPLAPVLQRMLKRSNNDYAESLLQNVCKDDGSWTYDHCREAVTRLVKGLKAPKRRGEATKDYTHYYTIIDGSGLSHSNRTSAEAQVMLLRYAYHNNKIFKPLYDNLPIAGVDGTIGRRMKQDATYNNVHAKTGTIDGVSTLAGYVTAANGHVLAFSILVNETSKSNGHNVQDDICLELAR